MSNRRPLSMSDYRTLARFRRALRAFLRFSEDAARAAGLTPAQHQLLLAIKGHPNDAAPSASDVADALQLRLHSAVGLIGRAEAAGLVVRHPDPVDARRHLLSLTPLGVERLEGLSRQHRAELRDFADMMNVLRALD